MTDTIENCSWTKIRSSDGYNGLLFVRIIGGQHGVDIEEQQNINVYKRGEKTLGYYDRIEETWFVQQELVELYKENEYKKYEDQMLTQLQEFEGQAITNSLIRVIAHKLYKNLRENS